MVRSGAGASLAGQPVTSLGWARGLGGSLLAWCLGVALQLQQSALWPVAAYGLGLACVVAAGWLMRWWAHQDRNDHRLTLSARWALWGLLWAVSAFHVTGLHAWTRAHTIDPALEGQDLDVVGVVQAMPQRQDMGKRARMTAAGACLHCPSPSSPESAGACACA